MPSDPTLLSHQEWLGYVPPVGVVVTITALTKAGVTINRNFVPLHREFLAVLPTDKDGDPIPELRDFPSFATGVLGWNPTDLQPPSETLEHAIAGYPDVLRPTYVVRDGETALLLIEETTALDLDAETPSDGRHWNASPQMKFERLLRETGVAAGLLVNQQAIRLVYAPKGESSGHITFSIADMTSVAGRPILAALHMLLCVDRLFIGLPDQRLPALLASSRKHQNDVSTKLSRQVMEALFDLLRGFQAAHNQTNGELLADTLRNDPNQVYRALLTVLLRMVFVLYAEDRDMLSSHPVFSNFYSINGLFESLRADQGRYSDTMDSRYGAWARLLSLFRIIFAGTQHGKLKIPGRKGYLFDPERFPFLEGRTHQNQQTPQIPRVSDGVIYRVLAKLLVLDGERLSYRSLDVEQIGSVYEAMMGFELHVAAGPSIAIKAKKKTGAPVTVNLKALLALPAAKRNEWLGKNADQKVTGAAERGLKSAETVNDLLAALDGKIAKDITPSLVPKGAMIFQPSPERRRSGSHYTPRSLTAPIVEATLAPILKQLGERPKPQQILALQVCDPAMGSGAFLVEACRQLGDALSTAWRTHSETPILPPDEDELLHARRLVAQRCLYGVDKNEMAVDLAKLSLWLATLARDHEFTFLNHSLRHGDSLAGLTARQVAAFNWVVEGSQSFLEKDVRDRIKRAADFRSTILSARDDTPYETLSQKLAMAEEQLALPRMAGDLVLNAFFEGDRAAARNNNLEVLQADMQRYVERGEDALGVQLDAKCRAMRKADKPIVPFHWELEFPEVFQLSQHLRAQSGFDAMVGNPPFAGKNTLIDGNAEHYLDWLKALHEDSHGNSDLVAHFFRRAFNLLRQSGTFGLIATNTIGQGDTRSTGLRWICKQGGTIYRARKRRPWPGEAAVIVSVVNVHKGPLPGPYLLDSRSVERITAYLFHAGGHDNPATLIENADKSFQGSIVLGMGFTFDDTDTNGVASPISEMRRLIKEDKNNAKRIFPYLGGEEVNNSPKHEHHRYVINFEDFPLKRKPKGHSWFELTEETQRAQLRDGIVAPDCPRPVAEDWPELIKIVRERVKPGRDVQNRDALRLRWWQYAEKRPGLVRAIAKLQKVLVVNCAATPHWALALVPSNQVFSHKLCVFPFDAYGSFAVLQSRIHEIWARFFSATLEDRLQYSLSDAFDTFPLANHYASNVNLEEVGKAYYQYRAKLMIEKGEGLTKTYNRFHDQQPSEDINKLRQLHDQMDRAVLDAYGWKDLKPVCESLPEFEEDDESDQLESGRAPKKKYRYRWPDDMHDEVLARLLALNQERAAAQNADEIQPAPQFK